MVDTIGRMEFKMGILYSVVFCGFACLFYGPTYTNFLFIRRESYWCPFRGISNFQYTYHEAFNAVVFLDLLEYCQIFLNISELLQLCSHQVALEAKLEPELVQ